jgi:hypothetical protein
VSFAAITLCVASQRVFIIVVYFVMTQSGKFWINPRTVRHSKESSDEIIRITFEAVTC